MPPATVASIDDGGVSDNDRGEAKRQHYGITFAVLAISGASYALLQSAVATGMNTVMRTLGGSVGGQAGASLITGTVVASGLPAESGFTLAFSFAAGACLLAALASLIVPKGPSRSHTAAMAMASD